MGDSSLYAAYEEAVVNGIGKSPQLKTVDRGELARLVKERKLLISRGSLVPQRAVIAADLLVVPQVVTIDSRPYLLIQAVHAATTSCLGRLRLAIDSARPDEFVASIPRQTARWWPACSETCRLPKTVRCGRSCRP